MSGPWKVVLLAAAAAAGGLGLGYGVVRYQVADAAPAKPTRPARPACPSCPQTGWNYGCAVCHFVTPQPIRPAPQRPVTPPPHCPPHCPPPPRMPRAEEVFGDPEPAVDLLAMPNDVRRHNIAAKGLGCCVFRSLDYASWWQNEPSLHQFPEWMVKSGIAGGGWPQKVDQLIPKIAKDRGMPTPKYMQYEGSNPAVIELALKTGRPVSITWQGNHMLSCVYLDAEKGAIVDNNAPDRVQWFPRPTFLSKWTAPSGKGGWCVVLLNPGPPPAPRNLTPAPAPAPRAARCCEAPGCKCYPCACRGADRCDPACECESAAAEARDVDWDLRRPRRPRPRPRPKPKFEDVTPAEDVPAGVIEWTAPPRERYTLCGAWCSEAEALRAIVGDSLTDDSARNHVTVIGAEAGRKAVLADLASSPALAPWLAKSRVQAYDPTAWELGCGFQAKDATKPTVYVQTADGRVLLRASYAGAKTLAQGLRRSDPSYQPSADPDGSPPPVKPSLTPSLPPWATPERCAGATGLAGFGAAAYLLLRRRQQGHPQQPAAVATATATAPAPASLAEQLGQRVLDRALAKIMQDIEGQAAVTTAKP